MFFFQPCYIFKQVIKATENYNTDNNTKNVFEPTWSFMLSEKINIFQGFRNIFITQYVQFEDCLNKKIIDKEKESEKKSLNKNKIIEHIITTICDILILLILICLIIFITNAILRFIFKLYILEIIVIILLFLTIFFFLEILISIFLSYTIYEILKIEEIILKKNNKFILTDLLSLIFGITSFLLLFFYLYLLLKFNLFFYKIIFQYIKKNTKKQDKNGEIINNRAYLKLNKLIYRMWKKTKKYFKKKSKSISKFFKKSIKKKPSKKKDKRIIKDNKDLFSQ